MNFYIEHSLMEESREAWVWLPKKISGINDSISLIEIFNPINGRKIIVNKRTIDSNYLRKRHLKERDSVIYINEHYRNILQIEVKIEVNLNINPVKWFHLLKRTYYFYDHPNDSVRISFWLATISIIIGIISIVISL